MSFAHTHAAEPDVDGEAVPRPPGTGFLTTALSRCRGLSARLACRVWGHHVDNHAFERASTGDRRCRCGARYLPEDGRPTHVRHTLRCFVGHHTYKRLVDRDGVHEYVCVQCGHPLLFRAHADPYAGESEFPKKVRYLCGLLGHRVAVVSIRDGFVEYACHCGHSFLKHADAHATIHHPLVCRLRGHWVHYVTRRGGFAEYVCRTCGHPFCFADPRR
jgi:hypothetical protein